LPFGLSFTTKGLPFGLGRLGGKTPGVIGKSIEAVDPTMYALPDPSAWMPKPVSLPEPPKNVEYVTDELPLIVVSTNVMNATPLAAPVV